MCGLQCHAAVHLPDLVRLLTQVPQTDVEHAVVLPAVADLLLQNPPHHPHPAELQRGHVQRVPEHGPVPGLPALQRGHPQLVQVSRRERRLPRL